MISEMQLERMELEMQLKKFENECQKVEHSRLRNLAKIQARA